MDGMDHGHGGATMAAPPPAPHRKMMMMHMTFFWGKNTEVVFDGWPGTSVVQYALSLLVVFVVAVLVEWISRCQLIKKDDARRHVIATGLVRTVMHAVRMGLAYLVMLAVMSFNGGIFLAAVAGHAVGFFVFGARVFGKAGEGNSDLPAMSC